MKLRLCLFGLTELPDGTMLVSGFVTMGMIKTGFVAELSIAADGSAAEVDLPVAGLKKPVGVLDVGADLFVSDQDLLQILAAPLADPGQMTQLALVASADLLIEGPAGALLTGGKLGQVSQISGDGEVTVPFYGYQEVRGLAYDAAHGRLFVVDHDHDPADGTTHRLHIVPLSG